MAANLDDPNYDITTDLESLQFESVLDESEKAFIPLRNRSHCMLMHACAQSAFFVKLLDKFRFVQRYITNANRNKAMMKVLFDFGTNSKEPLNVGIIGAGRLGSYIAKVLIEQVKIPPGDIRISTRRPDVLENLTKVGVKVEYNNVNVASQSDVLFLCVLPSHIQAITEEIQEHLSPQTFVMVWTSMVSIARLQLLLNHVNLFSVRYTWNDALASQWLVARTVETCFKTPQVLKQMCPLYSNESEETFVSCDAKLFTVWVYAVTNLCSMRRFTLSQTLEMLNYLFLDIQPAINPANGTEDVAPSEPTPEVQSLVPAPERISLQDLLKGELNGSMPIFDLCEIASRVTFFDKKLEQSPHLKDELLAHFLKTFADMLKKTIL